MIRSFIIILFMLWKNKLLLFLQIKSINKKNYLIPYFFSLFLITKCQKLIFIFTY